MRNLTLTTGKYPTNLRESLTQAFGEISLNTRILLLAAVAALAAIGFIFMAQFMLWQVALLVIAAWTPLVVQRCLLLLKRDCKLVVWFGLLVAQTPHMGEHCAQMVYGFPSSRPLSLSHIVAKQASSIDTKGAAVSRELSPCLPLPVANHGKQAFRAHKRAT